MRIGQGFGVRLASGLLMILLSLVRANVLTAQYNEAASLNEIMKLFEGTWTGQGKAEDGANFKSKLTFEWTLDRNFIRVNNVLTTGGESQLFAETIYGWQPVFKRVVFWSFDRDGNINEGSATLEGGVLQHEWRSFTRSGEIRDWKSEWSSDGHNTATFTLFEPKEGEWEKSFTMTYSRKQ